MPAPIHEKDLTIRSAELINKFQELDNNTNRVFHTDIITIAGELGRIIQDYNRLVRHLRTVVDPQMMPEIQTDEPPVWEN